MNGKGDKPRPLCVSWDVYSEHWDQTFKADRRSLWNKKRGRPKGAQTRQRNDDMVYPNLQATE